MALAGKYDEAAELFARAVEAAEERKADDDYDDDDDGEVMMGLLQLSGEARMEAGDGKGALEIFLQGLTVAQEVGGESAPRAHDFQVLAGRAFYKVRLSQGGLCVCVCVCLCG